MDAVDTLNRSRLAVATGSPHFPAAVSSIAASERAVLDQSLADLQVHKTVWLGLRLDERIHILDEVLERLRGVGERWVAASLEAKGMPPGGFAEAEEWVILAGVFFMVHRHRQVLSDIRRDGAPLLPGVLRTRAGGQVVAPVYPPTRRDGLLMMGMRAETWLEPGVARAEAVRLPPFLRPGAGQPDAVQPKVTLILGAGNAALLPPADFLSKLFTEGQVVMLKMNPVNDYLGPLYEEAFEPLIRAGFLRIAYGGPDVGSYLGDHPAVDAIHLTGSDKTHDAIVFGDGAKGAARKAAGLPLNPRPITAELGGVNPVIVVPGPWNERDIKAKAAQLAVFLYSNAGFSCLTPRLLIQAQGWPGREALIRQTGAILEQAGVRPAYYPGAIERHGAFLSTYPNALRFGQAAEGQPPWALICDLDASRADEMAFRSESFCGVCAETALAADDPVSFLSQAVAFANETLWGSLTATILVHPRSLKDRRLAQALDQAIAGLRYGTVTVNSYPALAYTVMLPPWGAFPGHQPHDIQSGSGKVNNFFHLNQPQKSVVWAPFGGLNPLVLTSASVTAFGRKVAGFAASPSLLNLMRTMLAALR